MNSFDLSLRDTLMFMAIQLFRFDRLRAEEYAKTFEYSIRAYRPRVKNINAQVNGSVITLNLVAPSCAADLYATLKANLSMHFAPVVICVNDALGVVEFRAHPNGSSHHGHFVYTQIKNGPVPLLF